MVITSDHLNCPPCKEPCWQITEMVNGNLEAGVEEGALEY